MRRGLSDTLENLLPFTVATVLWWLAVVLVIPAPAATLTLLAVTDPRRSQDATSLSVGEAIRLTRENLRRGWKMALLLLPPFAILGVNLWGYSGGGSSFSALTPLWATLILLLTAVSLAGLSCAALFEKPATAALWNGAALVARHLPRAILLVLLVWLLLVVGTALVMPLALFVPAAVAALANRFTLAAAGIPVVESLDPSPERALEDERRRLARRFGP